MIIISGQGWSSGPWHWVCSIAAKSYFIFLLKKKKLLNQVDPTEVNNLFFMADLAKMAIKAGFLPLYFAVLWDFIMCYTTLYFHSSI